MAKRHPGSPAPTIVWPLSRPEAPGAYEEARLQFLEHMRADPQFGSLREHETLHEAAANIAAGESHFVLDRTLEGYHVVARWPNAYESGRSARLDLVDPTGKPTGIGMMMDIRRMGSEMERRIHTGYLMWMFLAFRGH